MSTRLHHATAKRAATLGFMLEIDEDGDVLAMLGTRVVAHGASGKEALAAAEAKLAEAGSLDALEETDEDELDADEPDTKSVIKRKYRGRYKPHQATCGDDLAMELKAFLFVQTEEGPRVDEERLERFGRANGCWVETYEGLNVGMRRMNVVNRLRAKIRKGHEVVWAE